MTPAQRLAAHKSNTDRIDTIMNGRKMGECDLSEQREIFNLGMACVALEMGASPDSIVYLKPKKVDQGQPFDCEHFADGAWHKVTISRTWNDNYKPISDYPHKMEAYFGNLCNPAEFRNFIYK